MYLVSNIHMLITIVKLKLDLFKGGEVLHSTMWCVYSFKIIYFSINFCCILTNFPFLQKFEYCIKEYLINIKWFCGVAVVLGEIFKISGY